MKKQTKIPAAWWAKLKTHISSQIHPGTEIHILQWIDGEVTVEKIIHKIPGAK